MKTLEEIFFGDDNQKSRKTFRSINNKPILKKFKMKQNLVNSFIPKKITSVSTNKNDS